MGDTVTGEDDVGEEEELSVGWEVRVSGRKQREVSGEENARAKHVGQGVILLVDGDGGSVGDLRILIDDEPEAREEKAQECQRLQLSVANEAKTRKRSMGRWRGRGRSLGLAVRQHKEFVS